MQEFKIWWPTWGILEILAVHYSEGNIYLLIKIYKTFYLYFIAFIIHVGSENFNHSVKIDKMFG